MHDLGETSRTSIKLFYVLKWEIYALKLWGDYNLRQVFQNNFFPIVFCNTP